MGSIVKLELNENDYKNITDEALKQKDYLKAISNAKALLNISKEPASVYLTLAEIYESIDSSNLERTCLFKALACAPEGALLNEIKFNLAISYLKEGNQDVAKFYAPDILDDFEVFEKDVQTEKPKLRLFDRKSDEYNEEIFEEGLTKMHQGDYLGAAAEFERVDKDSSFYQKANYMALIVLLMKDDMAAVIENGERMLKSDPDNLAVKCTLATTYLSEKQEEKGRALLDNILSSQYDTLEAAFLVTPLLANFKMHEKVLEFSKIVLDKGVINPPAFIWYAEALYNTKHKSEAYSLLKKLDLCFGEEFPIKYFLSQIDDGVAELEYVIAYPPTEVALRMHLLKKYIKMSSKELDAALDSTTKKGELCREIFRWVFTRQDNKIKHVVIDKIQNGSSEWGRKILEEQLMNHLLGSDVTTHIFIGVVNMTDFVDVNLVSDGRFNRVFYAKTKSVGKLNKLQGKMFCFALANILHTAENPSIALEKFNKVLDVLVPVDEKGEKIENEKTKAIDSLRSLRTLIAVVEAKLNHKGYENPREDMIKVFHISGKMFDKYYTTIFGDENHGI